jgi:hypothetical protein
MKFKALFGLAVVLGMVYIGYEFLPPYFANFQFQDDVSSVAKFSSLSNKSEDDIRNEVIKKATEHDIHLQQEQVKITRDGKQLSIVVNYSVTVSLVGGKDYVLQFNDVSQ